VLLHRPILVRTLFLAALLLTGAGAGRPVEAGHAVGAAACPRAARTLQVLNRQVLTGDVQGPPLVDTAAGHVFLTSVGGGMVWMFDACSGKLLHTSSLGPNLYGSALDARHSRLFVAQASLAPAYAATNVLILDTHTGALLRTIAVPRTAERVYQPQMLAVAAGSGRLWVLSQCAKPGSAPMPVPCSEAVDLYDPHTQQIRQVAEVGPAGLSLVVDEPANRVYVLDLGALYVLDGRTGALVRRMPELFATGLVVDPTTGRLYMPGALVPGAPPDPSQISVLDGASGALIFHVHGAGPVVLDQRHNRVIVACDANLIADICQYDARTGRLLPRSTSREQFTVRAVDEADGLLLGLSRLTGKAGLIEERTGKVLSTLSVSSTPMAQNGAFSLTAATYDSRTGRAFVLDNPASTDPTAGLVNTLITLAIPFGRSQL
jgi:DNA-binding beta-propeller fold protein YncE